MSYRGLSLRTRCCTHAQQGLVIFQNLAGFNLIIDLNGSATSMSLPVLDCYSSSLLVSATLTAANLIRCLQTVQLYIKCVQPLVKKHEEEIDRALENGWKKMEGHVFEVKSKTMTWLSGQNSTELGLGSLEGLGRKVCSAIDTVFAFGITAGEKQECALSGEQLRIASRRANSIRFRPEREGPRGNRLRALRGKNACCSNSLNADLVLFALARIK
eukprot:1178707-Prorocentrum_minimum.AAC.5